MEHPAVTAAIERGRRTAEMLIEHRDALFPHFAALLRITGSPEGLRACVAGVAEAVIIAERRMVETVVIPFAEGGEEGQ